MASPGKRRRKKLSGVTPTIVEVVEEAPKPKKKPKKRKGFFDKEK